MVGTRWEWEVKVNVVWHNYISISNHWSLVNSLDANNCVTLFSLLLMEQKVILHSSRPSLLTCVGEALTSVCLLLLSDAYTCVSIVTRVIYQLNK